MVLLTHTHAITNVKENLLVELTHVPMGLLAVFAGWARWLEIRLPPEDRAIPSLDLASLLRPDRRRPAELPGAIGCETFGGAGLQEPV